MASAADLREFFGHPCWASVWQRIDQTVADLTTRAAHTRGLEHDYEAGRLAGAEHLVSVIRTLELQTGKES